MNHPITLLKTLEKKQVRKCQKRLQTFNLVSVSRDKNVILLLACFGLIFTRSLTLLSLWFLSHYTPSFPGSARTESNTESGIFTKFFIPNESISELNVNR